MILQYALIYSQISESNLLVRCGDWDLKGTEETLPHQDRNVVQKSIHPLYTGTSGTSKKVNYNFALLHMDKDFDLDVHINPICLPDTPNKKTGMYIFYKTPRLVANNLLIYICYYTHNLLCRSIQRELHCNRLGQKKL